MTRRPLMSAQTTTVPRHDFAFPQQPTTWRSQSCKYVLTLKLSMEVTSIHCAETSKIGTDLAESILKRGENINHPYRPSFAILANLTLTTDAPCHILSVSTPVFHRLDSLEPSQELEHAGLGSPRQVRIIDILQSEPRRRSFEPLIVVYSCPSPRSCYVHSVLDNCR